MFGNGGYYNKPHAYTRVEDSEGNVLLENVSNPTQVFSPETTTVMNRLLYQVTNGSLGTGRGANLTGMQTIGKTGTTENNNDYWFVGLTPYYVGAMWVGYDTPKPMSYSGYYPPTNAWKIIMTEVHKDLEAKSFPLSSNVQVLSYCAETGQIATEYCPNKITGYYKPSNIPPTCETHTSDIPEIDWGFGEESGSSREPVSFTVIN